MNWPLALIIALSLAASALGYWHAQRLHLRIEEIDPQFCGLITHAHDWLTRLFKRKD